MTSESVTVLEYLESRLAALEKATSLQLAAHQSTHTAETRAVDIAREELNHWKNTHNELQRKIEISHTENIRKEDYIREHAALSKKIESVERLVYMGVGLAVTVEFVLNWFIKH